ncbi:hypothetical protein KKC45_00095 [Patescibacteria group bacterium]|nr:hypothetical protein [Patescibacteria group bacterium]
MTTDEKMAWPKYYNRMILQPNPKGDVGVVCCWTKKEDIEKKLDEETKERVCALGQLYSRDGLNYIIRNSFLNPNLKYFVITGLKLSDSSIFFNELLEGKIDGEDVLQKEIPREKIKQFVEWFKDHSYFVEEDELDETIKKLNEKEKNWIEKTEDFPEFEYPKVNSYPSEKMGFRLEDKKIADLWLKVVDRVMKFGHEKPTQYGDMHRELIDVVTVVSGENPDNFYLPEHLTYTREELDDYLKQVMTKEIPEGLSYTYGSRLRDHKNVNQIQSMIDKLKEEDFSRRAVGVLWNVEWDNSNPKPPCLNLVQALVSENKVYFSCYFRSNDMFGSWPQNAMAMRSVHKEIADALGKEMGKMIIVSTSAHIYERDYEKAKKVLEDYKPKLECAQDPRGSFVIELKESKIKVIHMTPDGQAIGEFFGDTAIEIMNQVYPFISDILHALDLGAELQKAEIALKQGINFKQDNPLELGDDAPKVCT